MKLSVVIPVYNEVETIKEIVSRVQAVDLEKEIIIVDDGSTDGTRELLQEISLAQKNVRVFFFKNSRTHWQKTSGEILSSLLSPLISSV